MEGWSEDNMKTLDRYIIRGFLFTAFLFFVIIISLRVVLDLNFNIDEFLKGNASGNEKFWNILSYYAYQIPMYIVELGGIIIVASAAFTLARMNHSNELTAILASGVSLRRVVVPIFLFAIILDVAIVADRELLIPSIANKMIKDREIEQAAMTVRLATDNSGTVWYSQRLDGDGQTMLHPRAIVRTGDGAMVGIVSGSIARQEPKGWRFENARIARANSDWAVIPNTERVYTNGSPWQMIDQSVKLQAVKEQLSPQKTRELQSDVYQGRKLIVVNHKDEKYGLRIEASRLVPGPRPSEGSDDEPGGRMVDPKFTFFGPGNELLGEIRGSQAIWGQGPSGGGYWQIDNGYLFLASDLKVEDIKMRQSSRWLDYKSMQDLGKLVRNKKVTDVNAALLARHIRFTDPINNVVMLLLGLPFILSRERNIKASAALCLLFVATFYVFIYICRYMNVEPSVGAWLPILLFGPISIVMLDSVKT